MLRTAVIAALAVMTMARIIAGLEVVLSNYVLIARQMSLTNVVILVSLSFHNSNAPQEE